MDSTPWSLTRESASMLTGAAILAPSSHNTQPWIFRVRNSWAVLRTFGKRHGVAARPHWLQASFLNQPIQITPLRSRRLNPTGQAGFPPVLLRLGYPESELPSAPRRPPATVIEYTETPK